MREFEEVLLLLFKANTLAEAETLSGKIHCCYNFLIQACNVYSIDTFEDRCLT